MSALPKAKSQGSNTGGGGALTAFTAISAARAEPEPIAKAVANKTIFFMTIPITVELQPHFRAPGRARKLCGCWNSFRQQPSLKHNGVVKQQTQAFAQGIGILRFPG
jgi:hypothetical protein